MAIDLLKVTTEKLGYQPLKPVSSVNREVNENANNVAQAIIPSVLAGFLNLSGSDEGLSAIVNYDGDDWPTILFNDRKTSAMENISKYSGLNNGQILPEINKTSRTVVEIIMNEVKGSSDINTSIKNFLKDQRTVILDHLPVSLEMGTLLEDEQMDDHTNKMQGPISTLLHKISESFDKGDTQEKLDEKSRNF